MERIRFLVLPALLITLGACARDQTVDSREQADIVLPGDEVIYRVEPTDSDTGTDIEIYAPPQSMRRQ